MIVREYQDLLFISQNAHGQRTNAGGISQMGRATQGVGVMNIGDDDKVSAVALVVESTTDAGAEVETEDVASEAEAVAELRPRAPSRPTAPTRTVADLRVAESGLPEEGGGPNSHA